MNKGADEADKKKKRKRKAESKRETLCKSYVVRIELTLMGKFASIHPEW